MIKRRSELRILLDSAVISPCIAVYRAIIEIGKYRIDLHPGRIGLDTDKLVSKWFKDGRMTKTVMFGLLISYCLGWTVIAGLDLNWDLLNYHYYVAHAFWTDRLGKDFMPASIQSYLNPIAYLPFYWMVQAGWHSLIIGLVLAALHSVNLILLLLISEKALFHDVRYRHIWGFTAAFTGGLSPLFLSEVGSTFNDVTSTIGILLGLYLIFCRTELSVHVFLAGLAMGVATGMKLTNAIFLVAAVPSLLIVFGSWNVRTKAFLLFSAGAALGFVLVEGYWGYRVYQEFGNPFFPYMNKFFAAPDFPNVNIVNDRFLPRSLQDIVTLPLRMVSVESWIYTEVSAPDLRFMALIVFVAIGLFLLFIRIWRKEAILADWRPDKLRVALVCFFAFSLLFWLASSGNGRYGLPVFLLVGPLLIWSVYWALSANVAVLVTGAILVFQIVHMTNGQNPRWTPVPWKAEWFDITVPYALTQQPYLYLSQGVQTFSFVIPYLHPESAFTNILGQWSIPSDGYGSVRLWDMLRKYDGRIRILAPYPRSNYVDGKPSEKLISVINTSLDRLKLQVIPASCQPFQIQLLERTSWVDSSGNQEDTRGTLMSCHVSRKEHRDSRLAQEEHQLAPAYFRFEAACPNLFSPPGAALEKVDKYWKKYYANSDISLWSDGVWLVYSRSRALVNVRIGKVSEFLSSGIKIDCNEIRRPARHMSEDAWTY